MEPFEHFRVETSRKVTTKKAWELLAEIRHNSCLGFATRKTVTFGEQERTLKTLGLIREVASGYRITSTGRQILKERGKSRSRAADNVPSVR
jgi:hypothetical protein